MPCKYSSAFIKELDALEADRKQFERCCFRGRYMDLATDAHPDLWGGDKDALRTWYLSPYSSPYNNGAYYGWRAANAQKVNT